MEKKQAWTGVTPDLRDATTSVSRPWEFHGSRGCRGVTATVSSTREELFHE